MNRSPSRAALLVAVAATTLAHPAIGGASSASARSSDSSAMVRGAHFSPDTPGVDVYLTGFAGGTTHMWLSDVGYGDVSPYRRLAAGTYTVAMRPHGAPASTPAALSWVLRAQPGHAYTTAAVGMNKQLHAIVLSDRLTPPGSGTGRVRVIQAASRATRASVTAVNGPVIAKNVAFGTSTPYRTVPAGTWPVGARSLATPKVSAHADVKISSGAVTTIVLLDGKHGGITLRSVVDAAGAVVAPVGAVPGGGGGTAPAPGHWWPGAALLLGAIALAGAVGARHRRGTTPTGD